MSDQIASRFEVVARRRPVEVGRDLPGPVLAPYVAVEQPVAGDRVELALASGGTALRGWWDSGSTGLVVAAGGRTTRHRSRRHGRTTGRVTAAALALTGTHLTLLTREEEGGSQHWLARGRVDLRDRVDTHDEAWLAGLAATAGGPLRGFGQLGLRDLRVVSNADGTAYRPDGPDGPVLLTATSAGPGFFDTAHTSVWSLDPGTLALAHRADLFFRRPDRPGVYGDHATHLLRDGDRWLVATSTWGDFDRRRPVRVTLAESSADLTTGRHVLDTRELPLPTDGLRSVAVWDPHLARTDDGWLVGYVSARRYFRFHPALAAGPTLADLSLRAADAAPRECEGTTLLRVADGWRVLASDKRRRAYPVHDLDLRPLGTLDAPYLTNIPWPTLVEVDGAWLMVGFDATPAAGPLPGYGTHGDVVVLRAESPGGPPLA
ncbi:hypothetical protein [Nocardioides pantholopis]|uniref:hypothetical protein n=1 Tax=Nocardioides pantholopis TaxID=2483798 RepID=UPI0019D0D168|nr:hypothetical protein [Nocardioides pantholopis]